MFALTLLTHDLEGTFLNLLTLFDSLKEEYVVEHGYGLAHGLKSLVRFKVEQLSSQKESITVDASKFHFKSKVDIRFQYDIVILPVHFRSVYPNDLLRVWEKVPEISEYNHSADFKDIIWSMNLWPSPWQMLDGSNDRKVRFMYHLIFFHLRSHSITRRIAHRHESHVSADERDDIIGRLDIVLKIAIKLEAFVARDQ